MRLAASWAGELCVSPHSAGHRGSEHRSTRPGTEGAQHTYTCARVGRRARPCWHVWLCLWPVWVSGVPVAPPGCRADQRSAARNSPRALPVARVAPERCEDPFGFRFQWISQYKAYILQRARRREYERETFPLSRFRIQYTNTSTLHWNWSADSTLLRTPAIITSASRPLVAGVRMGMPPSAAAARR